MGAFDGVRFYQISQPNPTEEIPAQAAYPGDWKAENSNAPFIYPWGRKVLNPGFIGPHRLEDLKLPFAF
jgi:hypothetical protein